MLPSTELKSHPWKSSLFRYLKHAIMDTNWNEDTDENEKIS
jgi:hypothetical protein